ncbi:hypothetical protein F5876DRAFT_75720 [Lentinula aff. lateritia]|uniref:Uncharacterized protein n=1 Tax=Lentinula aff. lateritia TaxID=2804960 RepID=A0ACC1U399_9AGAR|nr:hypothetical protein F5876DRAFT_75720 [Lentinula aff. lateritia]
MSYNHPKGYILTNAVSHTRFIPFLYSFKYTTIAVFVEISALEDSKLDTPFLFGYNKRWRSLCSLSSDGYLLPSSGIGKMGFRGKVGALLKQGGCGDVMDGTNEIWMLSMPSYLGFEGINPLTVYLIYSIATPSSVFRSEDDRESRKLRLVLFEVHNTFGEGHVYFMRPGIEEDSSLKRMYDHQWTFPRAFHVSPFNDRKGWYTVSIKLPQFPDANRGIEGNPKPVISIQLREPNVEANQLEMPGQTKLIATLRATNALPLPSARNVLFTLVSYPLELFMSMPRILYQAGILHYRKGDDKSDLKVYIRPEPFLPPPSFAPSSKNSVNSEIQIYPAPGAGFTTRRRQPGVLGSWAKEYVRAFLRTHVDKNAELAVVLIGPDIDTEEWFLPGSTSTSINGKGSETHNTVGRGTRILRITPLAPEFFELLLTAPSAGMILLAGGIVDDPPDFAYSRILNSHRGPNDVLFVVNDPELFLDIFNGTLPPRSPFGTASLAQRLRLCAMPSSLVTLSQASSGPQINSTCEQETESRTLTRLLRIPATHFLESRYPGPLSTGSSSTRARYLYLSTIQGNISNVGFLILLMTILTLSALEPRIFALFRARIRNETETWSAKIWERVERRVHLTRDKVGEVVS